MTKTAFIGLGIMGYPMAGHLKKAGHTVTVNNRTAEKAKKWVAEYDGEMADTPADAARDADVVFTCVGNDDDLRAVVLGDTGALAAMKTGSVLVDNTTTSATVAREIYAAAKEKGVGFLDAPVSGGQIGAETGVLTVMVGGDQAAFDKAAPVIDAFARAVTWMGGAGAGQLTKMANQITIVGIVEGLAEGITFAEKAGLDPARVIEAISKGSAQSWQMDNRASTMIEDKFDFGFAVDLMRKDLGIAITEANRIGAPVSQVEAARSHFNDLSEKMGGGRWDFTSLIRVLRKD